MGLPENMQPGPTILMINYNFLYQMQFGYYASFSDMPIST